MKSSTTIILRSVSLAVAGEFSEVQFHNVLLWKVGGSVSLCTWSSDSPPYLASKMLLLHLYVIKQQQLQQ